MKTTADLGKFLRSRRARLTPEAVGLVSYGTRRVPGLRREELAQLAGISATYYTRLEQGKSIAPVGHRLAGPRLAARRRRNSASPAARSGR